MKSITALTIKQNINDTSRIGDELKRKDKENLFAVKVEEIFEGKVPLPTSFDVSCIQPPYFSEFSYNDLMGGIVLKTQNTEVNARLMEHAVKSCNDESYPNDAKDFLKDKYELQKTNGEAPRKIIFLPGSNLLGIENKEMILPMLWGDTSVAIKPHPNMTREGLKHFAYDYGWDKLIDKDISGFELLNGCEQAFSTSNSELGMVSAVLNKPHADITSVFHFERSTYSHIHRLFRPMDVEHNHKTFARVFNSTESGFIPPWAKNIEERVDGFINLAMNVREVFKPSFPDVSRWVRQTTNIKKGKE